MHLYTLLDGDLTHQMLDEGYLRKQDHPVYPLSILNYTEKTQFDRRWNSVTRACRGLIYDRESMKIHARPFPKFFNYGEEDVDHSYYSTPVTVTDKLDGSLGILYQYGSDLAIATRGSFQSVQALHANQVLKRAQYAGWWPPEGMTYLFEIIYPQNRIVCDYGQHDNLYFLGAVSIEDGWTTGPFLDWPGPRARVFEVVSFQKAIEMDPRPNAEGIVVHFINLDKRLKIKQADYVLLHRTITGLNERSVWEMMRAGKSAQDICQNLPDEFHQWVRDVAADLVRKIEALSWEADQNYRAVTQSLNEGWTRRDFAQVALKFTNSFLLFKRLDGKPFGDDLWKLVKPEYKQGPWSTNEDVA